jgi:hypothetical protein
VKKFIAKLLIFIASLILVFGVLEFIVFPNNNNQMTLKNELLKTKLEAEVLVLGNSHTFFGVNPNESKFKMLNIANKGRKLETDYYILKKNIESFKELNFVIIPISHYTLLAGELSSEEKRLYFRFFKIEEYSQNLIDNHLLFNEPFRELIDGVFLKKKKHHKEFISELGWKPERTVYKRNLKETKERIDSMEYKARGNIIIDRNLTFLDSITQLNIQKNVKIVFVTPPYHKDYYRYCNKEYHNEIDEILKLKAEEKENVFYIRGKSLNIYNDKYFKNSDHLNADGATIFTKKIDSILNIHL